MSTILELGQGETFLFDGPAGTITNNLPEGLKELEAGIGEGRPIVAIYCLNFGWNGAYLLAARTVNGAIIRRQNLPPQLEAWLIDPITHTCKRDIATLSVELGPNGSFYARDKDTYRWHNLPDALEEAIQQRLCPAGWTARPDFVVLGADGAFIYSNDCGGACHALGNYPRLQEFVLGLQRANIGGLTGFGLLQWVSMSIFQPGHFVALQISGQHIAELSPISSQALSRMAGTFPARNTAPGPPPYRTVSQPMGPQASPPIVQQASPPPMLHGAMPIRKPVSPPVAELQAFPRPQPNHLVSSPIPQTHQMRPMPVHQSSAPALAIQPPAARPISTQLPVAQSPRTNANHRLSSANWKAAGQFASGLLKTSNERHNSSTISSNYSNASSNATVNNNTYVTGGDSGSAAGPTYVLPGDSGTFAPAYSGDIGTTPVYAADSGIAPGFTQAAVDSGTYSNAGDSGVYNSAGDSGSIISAGDSGVLDTLAASSSTSIGGDSGSGFWSGLGSVFSSGGDSGGGDSGC